MKNTEEIIEEIERRIENWVGKRNSLTNLMHITLYQERINELADLKQWIETGKGL